MWAQCEAHIVCVRFDDGLCLSLHGGWAGAEWRGRKQTAGVVLSIHG